MNPDSEKLLLIGAVAAVGILHTMVPDHWVPIALMARQRHWSKTETIRAALQAGTGHVLATLLIGVIAWVAGVTVAQRWPFRRYSHKSCAYRLRRILAFFAAGKYGPGLIAVMSAVFAISTIATYPFLCVFSWKSCGA